MAAQANAQSFLSPSPFPCLWEELPWAAGKKTQQDHEALYLEHSKSWVLALKPREDQNVAVSLTKMCVALWMRCISEAITVGNLNLCSFGRIASRTLGTSRFGNVNSVLIRFLNVS